MGESYTIVAFGVQEPALCVEDQSWIDWFLRFASQKGRPAILTSAGVKVQGHWMSMKLESSYEAEPPWLGFPIWQSSEDYASTPLEHALVNQAKAKEAWEIFRQIAKEETGIDLGEGRLIIASDHT